MYLDLAPDLNTTVVLMRLLFVIGAIALIAAFFSSIGDSIGGAIVGGTIFAVCIIIAIPLRISTADYPHPFAEQATKMEQFYGVEVPPEELAEYWNMDTDELYEFDIIDNNENLRQYAMKQKDGKVYLFAKDNNDYAPVKVVDDAADDEFDPSNKKNEEKSNPLLPFLGSFASK